MATTVHAVARTNSANMPAKRRRVTPGDILEEVGADQTALVQKLLRIGRYWIDTGEVEISRWLLVSDELAVKLSDRLVESLAYLQRFAQGHRIPVVLDPVLEVRVLDRRVQLAAPQLEALQPLPDGHDVELRARPPVPILPEGEEPGRRQLLLCSGDN